MKNPALFQLCFWVQYLEDLLLLSQIAIKKLNEAGREVGRRSTLRENLALSSLVFPNLRRLA
jgi:hypothetical protein